jgi:hypothetical protein
MPSADVEGVILAIVVIVDVVVPTVVHHKLEPSERHNVIVKKWIEHAGRSVAGMW